EVVFCSASTVLKYTQDELSQRGVFGTLVCTNFRVAFVSDQGPSDEACLCGLNLLPVYEDKRKLITGGMVKNKFPSKLLIHCKDLRVFQFALTYCLEEDAKRIFQGIAHHCLEPKSLRNVFAFAFSEKNSFPGRCGAGPTIAAVVYSRPPLCQSQSCKRTRMLTAVAHNYLFSVKTEDLSDTLPSVQDLQLAYNKFKHFFLIENTTDFWVSDVKWLSSLDSCGWLDIISGLQKAVEVVECLEQENANVLIMDPFYRTLSGFQSLIQKEWVAGGHRFLDRCNQLHLKDRENVSPVFLVFLECVWQLLQQYPPSFQFSETYLTVLSDSLHVPVFSTFLFNSQHHRHAFIQADSPHTPSSLLRCPVAWDWSVQFDCKAQELFINPLYIAKTRAPQRSQLHKHQRQLSLPSSGFKASPKKGFFKDEADSLKKMLRVKRLSRWMLSPDSSSSSREFYQAWQRRPLDYHGLIVPCLDGPRLRLWMQRYLRWVQEVQIFGGGLVTVLSRLYDLLDEVRGLRRELDYRAGSGPSVSWLPRTRGPGGETQTRGS
ncbi:hypothetical protein CRUP_016873, partial [Coryphaenoides rupestris]